MDATRGRGHGETRCSASTWFPWSKSPNDKGMLETLQETLGHRPAQCSCCATDRKDRHDCPGCKAEGAQVLICKHCESKHWIDHKLVTPINSERSVQCKTSSVEASRRASPPGLRVRKTNRRPGIRVDRVQGSRETMSIANNIDYGGAFSTIPCAAGAAPSELEVMRMSTVSAVPHRAAKVSRNRSKRPARLSWMQG